MNKDKKKISNRTIVATIIIVSLLVALFFAVLRLSSGDENGQRFSTIENRITDEQLDEALKRMNAEIGGQENVAGEVKGATVYIRIDMAEGMTAENGRGAGEHAYQILFEVLPREKYFTAPEGGMAYNIEIKSFDVLEAATFIMQGVKSFSMEEPMWQDLMVPRNEDAANRAQQIQDERDAERARQAQQEANPEPEPEPEAAPE